jgi:hypothetical protein
MYWSATYNPFRGFRGQYRSVNGQWYSRYDYVSLILIRESLGSLVRNRRCLVFALHQKREALFIWERLCNEGPICVNCSFEYRIVTQNWIRLGGWHLIYWFVVEGKYKLSFWPWFFLPPRKKNSAVVCWHVLHVIPVKAECKFSPMTFKVHVTIIQACRN